MMILTTSRETRNVYREMKPTFHQELRENIDRFVALTYKATRTFPREEVFGLTSQLRRALVSVALNYIEGSARFRPAVMRNFFEIAYGSLRECDYIIKLASAENYLSTDDARIIVLHIDKIGKMLFGMIKKI